MMIELTEKTLDPDGITAKVRRDTNGAVVTFLGTTRDNFEGKTVVTLEYEAFDEMAEKKLEEYNKIIENSIGPALAKSQVIFASTTLISMTL